MKAPHIPTSTQHDGPSGSTVHVEDHESIVSTLTDDDDEQPAAEEDSSVGILQIGEDAPGGIHRDSAEDVTEDDLDEGRQEDGAGAEEPTRDQETRDEAPSDDHNDGHQSADTGAEQESAHVPRRSTRRRERPKWFSDYVTMSQTTPENSDQFFQMFSLFLEMHERMFQMLVNFRLY